MTNKLKILALASAMALIAGCASSVKPVEYSSTTDARQEIERLDNDIKAAYDKQYDVTAAENLEEAEKHLQKAKKLQDKNEDNEDILKEVGRSQAYLNQAASISQATAVSISEVTTARTAALQAGARETHAKELLEIDKDFRSMTKKFEKNKLAVDVKEKSKLQQEYLDLELKAIKSAQLGLARRQYNSAISMGAKKYAPQTLQSAEGKLRSADAIISANRHDQAAVQAAAGEALAETQKLISVTQIASQARTQTDEGVALSMYDQNRQISNLDARMVEAQNTQQSQQQQLSEQQKRLQASQQETNSLQAERNFNTSLAEAQKSFDAEEAEVYRQGDNLLIRMKSVNFPSGRADLPAHSLSVLNKAKELIKNMNAEKSYY